MYEFIGRPNFNAIEKAKRHEDVSTKHPFNWHINYSYVRHSLATLSAPERERILYMLILWIIRKWLYTQRWTRCELLDHRTEIYYSSLRNKRTIQFWIYRFYDMALLLACPSPYHEYHKIQVLVELISPKSNTRSKLNTYGFSFGPDFIYCSIRFPRG